MGGRPAGTTTATSANHEENGNDDDDDSDSDSSSGNNDGGESGSVVVKSMLGHLPGLSVDPIRLAVVFVGRVARFIHRHRFF